MHKFDLLPEADQRFILDLCEKHTYAEAVTLLAEPRPVGLSILTSVPTLCRFYTRTHHHPCETQRLAEYAQSISARHQAGDGAHLAGLGLVSRL